MPDLIKRQRKKNVVDSWKGISVKPLENPKTNISKVVKPSKKNTSRMDTTDTGTGSNVRNTYSSTQGVKNGIVSATGQSSQGSQRMSSSKKKSNKPKQSKQEKMYTEAQKLTKQKRIEERQKAKQRSIRERIARAMKKGG